MLYAFQSRQHTYKVNCTSAMIGNIWAPLNTPLILSTIFVVIHPYRNPLSYACVHFSFSTFSKKCTHFSFNFCSFSMYSWNLRGWCWDSTLYTKSFKTLFYTSYWNFLPHVLDNIYDEHRVESIQLWNFVIEVTINSLPVYFPYRKVPSIWPIMLEFFYSSFKCPKHSFKSYIVIKVSQGSCFLNKFCTKISCLKNIHPLG